MSAFYWALLTACIWGVVPLLEKLGLAGGSPGYGVMVRSLGVALGLVLFGWIWSPLAALRSMSWQSIILLASGGLLASFIGQLAFYHALKTGAISQVTPVAGAYPLVAALLGWLFLREAITIPRMVGVLLIISGVWLLRK
jgi:transporter family protein